MVHRRLLAIDPGYDRCGVAVFENGTLLHSQCILTNKKDSHARRLYDLYEKLNLLIGTWNPSCVALETLFFSVNKKTALKVAEARGVVLLVAGYKNIPVIELSPQEIKLSITGVGNADKKQVQKMVSLLLKTQAHDRKLDDETDAIALGMTASQKLLLEQSKSTP